MKKELLLTLVCFLSALFLWSAQIRCDQMALAGKIAPKILRFHVIANSNSAQDQKIKLNVKSFLLDKIEEKLNEETDKKTQTKKEQLKNCLTIHKEELEKETENFIKLQGKHYPVSLEITECEFPEKVYGNIRLPAGTYETAQVSIGAARGHNWWCILYPRVCVTKDAVTAVPESSLEELRRLLAQEDYQELLFQRPELIPNLHFSFYTLKNLLPAHDTAQ